jgi:hypothetical protein
MLLILLIVVGCLKYSINSGHLLNTLLRLEIIAVRLFVILRVSGGKFFGLYYLVYMACEGALGLTLLVKASIRRGSDYFDRLGSVVC